MLRLSNLKRNNFKLRLKSNRVRLEKSSRNACRLLESRNVILVIYNFRTVRDMISFNKRVRIRLTL